MFRVAFVVAMIASTAAAAGELMVKNCSQGAVNVSGFNEKDEIRLFASSTETVNRGQTARVWCWTDSCQVRIWNGILPEKQFGPQNVSQCLVAGYSQYDMYPSAQNIDACSSERCY